MRIAIGEFGQETNSFAKGFSDFAALAPGGWIEADQVISCYRGTTQYLGGAIRAAEEEKLEIVPLPSIQIYAGPTIEADTLKAVVEHICAHLEAHKDGLDGIYFSLHGAGCAQGEDDIESYTLRALRRVVGEEMPIMSSLDLHANLSQEMVELTQGLFGIKENPHVDCHKAAYLAVKTLAATLRGEMQPRTALVKLPLLITPATGNTYNDPMKSVKEHFEGYCKEYGLVDATFFHGFSAADHPDSSASVVVVADGCDPLPHANALARYFWERRAEFIPVSLTPDQAIDQALEKRMGGYVVINEISDNPGSGCPGDGTYLLRALLKRDLPRTIFQYIRDGEVARQAHQAGVGARISVRVGAKTDDMHGEPIELDDVEVVALSDGRFAYTSPVYEGLWCELGLSARLRHGNVEFVVVTERTQTLDDGAITMTGSDIHDYDIVCLKSANHFRGFFESRADAIVTADPPGLRSSNLHTYPYRRITRPVYPLDPKTEFNP